MLDATAPPTGRADRLGELLSLGCILHCLASPLIAVVAAGAGLGAVAEGRVHLYLAVMVLVVGVLALAPGYRRHRRCRVPMAAAVGAALVWLPAVAGDSVAGAEPLLVVAGGLLLVRAHRWNRAFCANCTTCAIAIRGVPRLSG